MSRWSDVVELVGETFTENDMGDIIPNESRSKVFANKKSIRQSEFYQAQATGLKPAIAFEIHSAEYGEQEKLLYNKKTYNIIRTYDKGEFIELICEGAVNHPNA